MDENEFLADIRTLSASLEQLRQMTGPEILCNNIVFINKPHQDPGINFAQDRRAKTLPR